MQRVGAEVQRLSLRSHQPRIEQRKSIAADLYDLAVSLETGDDVFDINLLVLVAADGGPYAQQTVCRGGYQRPVMWDAVRENVRHRNFEGNREYVEPRENIFGRRLGTACARDSPQIAPVQVDEVENSLLIELI